MFLALPSIFSSRNWRGTAGVSGRGITRLALSSFFFVSSVYPGARSGSSAGFVVSSLPHAPLYIYTPRAFFLYGTLGWVILRLGLSLIPSLFLSSEPRDFAPSRRDYKSSAIKTVVRRFDGPCQDALSSQYRVTCTCGTPGVLALYINVLWSRPDWLSVLSLSIF